MSYGELKRTFKLDKYIKGEIRQAGNRFRASAHPADKLGGGDSELYREFSKVNETSMDEMEKNMRNEFSWFLNNVSLSEVYLKNNTKRFEGLEYSLVPPGRHVIIGRGKIKYSDRRMRAVDTREAKLIITNRWNRSRGNYYPSFEVSIEDNKTRQTWEETEFDEEEGDVSKQASKVHKKWKKQVDKEVK